MNFPGHKIATVAESMGPLQLERRLVGRQSNLDTAAARNADATRRLGRCFLDFVRRRPQVFRLHRYLQNSSWLERSQTPRNAAAFVVAQAFVLRSLDRTRTDGNGIHSFPRGPEVCARKNKNKTVWGQFFIHGTP